MSEQTEVSFDTALMMAIHADAQKELNELPTPAQLKERYPDTSRWDARLQAALHKHRPVLKRVLVAAMTLVILTLGALAVSADFRKAVYTMIQKFLPIEMQLTYQVDGEPLERLPDGYSDHYVLDGFEMDDAQKFERAENFLHVYSSKETEEKKNAHDQKNVRVAFCKIGNAVDCGTDHRSSFVDDLFHARLRSSGAIGCRLTACGLRRCA